MRATRCALALSASAVLACSTATPARDLPPNASRTAAPALVLHTADADVWAWRARVKGALRGDGALLDCAIFAGEVAFPAPVERSEFAADVALAPGTNLIQARCRERKRGVLRSPVVRYRVPLADAPTARARASGSGGQVVLDGSASTPSERSRAAIAEYTWFAAGPLGAPAQAALGSGARLAIAAPTGDGTHTYELRVSDAAGQVDTARAHVIVTGGHVFDFRPGDRPAWLREAVVYGVVPPLFGRPALRSVTAAVDRLADLGVTALWLSPIFESPEGDYGYAVVDYRAVRDEYGSEEELAALVSAAHARGLRVLLDLVPNHTSAQHPYFRQAQALGPRSHHHDFYDRDAHGRPTHYFDWDHLPNLEYDNDEVERFMTEVSLQWVRDLDVDGYRVDAAWGVVRRDREFFASWVAELRRVRPDALLVAEASARDAYYMQTGFDAAYDWTEAEGRWAWQDVFAGTPGVARRLHAAVEQSARHSPPERVLRFLNNNDTGARFITRHGEAMTRVATAALLTLPGVPCLFMFDEVGAEFLPYEAQEPIAPPDNEALRSWHARLIALRRSSPALQGAGFLPLHVGESDEAYAYLRAERALTGDGAITSEVAIVALNFGARTTTLRLSHPLLTRGVPRLRDALSGDQVSVRAGALQLTLPPWGVRVLEAERPAGVGEWHRKNGRTEGSKIRPRRESAP